MAFEKLNFNLVQNNGYTQNPIKRTYTDDAGNEYASYDDYVQAQKDNYFEKFRNIALFKQENYERQRDGLSLIQAKKESIYSQMKSNPNDSSIMAQYNDINNNYEDQSINADCALSSWIGAVNAQRRAIIV